MTSVLRPYSNSEQSRAAQRRQRLLEIENEQRREEEEALKITPEQRQILFQSFQSVKVEFSDLDGLSWRDVKMPWSPPGLPPTRTIPPSFRAQSFASLSELEYMEPSLTEQALSVLTNTHRSSPNLEATVRGAPPKSRPRLNSQLRSCHSAPVVTTLSTLSVPSKRSSSPSDGDAETAHVSKSPRPTPAESPIQPATPLSTSSQDYDSDSDRTICGASDEELPTPTSPRRERKKQQKSRRYTKTHRIAAATSRRSSITEATSAAAPTTPGFGGPSSPATSSTTISSGAARVPFPFLGSHPNTTTASN